MRLRLFRVGLVALVVSGTLGGAASAPASAGPSCEPRTASAYRYDPTDLRYAFLLRTCEDVEQVTFEIQFTRVDLITGLAFTSFALGVTECSQRRCQAHGHYPHGDEVARYEIGIFWFGIADDFAPPVNCFTRGTVSGCRPA